MIRHSDGRTYPERHVHSVHNDQTSDVKSARSGDINTVPPKTAVTSTIRDVVYLQDDISGWVDVRQLL